MSTKVCELRVPEPGTRNRLQSGFSLFELTIFIVLLSVIIGVFFDRVLFYQEAAEEIMMRQTVDAVNLAMNLQLASWVARGELRNIPLLAQRNPMNWLEKKPGNYAGEYYDPAPGHIPSGNWYFDLKDGSLVYLVKRDAHFHSKDRQRIRFRVDLGQNDLQSGSIGMVRLAPLHAHTWMLP